MNEPKTRPILFSAPMVRALLAGTKTQTRRKLKSQPSENWTPNSYGDVHPLVNGEPDEPDPEKIYPWGVCNEDGHEAYPCPYGQPGDRLWVKETSIIAPKRFATPDDTCIIDADGDPRFVQYVASHPNTEAAGWYKLKKSPSIFMPRWASRITLEIESVRVERLCDINESDAKTEGVEEFWHPTYSAGYMALWESINGNGSWAQNPWVWVVTFRKL